MGTQWRIGMGVPTGLDYNALPVVAKSLGIKLEKEVFDGVLVMESEALSVMDKKRKSEEKR